MLIHIISEYLESHRRLVIPQLGTFIVKEPGRSVVFSELLKRDDGVLRKLLQERSGSGELEAAGEIDRFTFEVRHAMQSGETYPLARFGSFRPGANGTIAFEHTPQAAAPKEQPESSELPEPTPQTAASEPDDSKPSHVHPEKIADAIRTAFTEPHVSASVKMNPDPSIRGLRYGKPRKTTDAYTYVDKPVHRLADIFLWIALAAAVIALGIIAFVYFNPIDKPVEPVSVEQELQIPTAEPTSADSEVAEEPQTATEQ